MGTTATPKRAESRRLREKKAISITLLTALILAAGVAHCSLCAFLPSGFSFVFVPLNLYFVVALVGTLVRIVFCDPGFLQGPRAEETPQSVGQMCQICGVCKPKFAHHCQKCGRCVALYDHHCNVFANCFGAGSVGYIFKFLLLTGVFLLLSSAELLAADFANFARRGALSGWGKFWAVYCAILSVYELVGGPVLVILAFRLCSNQVFRGVGQLERRSGLESNGQSRGQNFRAVFGRKWALALLLPGWTAQRRVVQ